MSSHQTFTSSSSTFTSSSSSSSSNGQQTTGHRSIQQTHTDPSGNTTIKSASQNLGEPITSSTQSYDASGNQMIGSGSGGASRRIEDVTDSEQAKRDAEYEERMEEEYAKREGGA